MLSDYNLKRKQYYLMIKSVVKTPIVGNLLLLSLGLLISIWGLSTDMHLWFLLLLILLIFLISTYIVLVIGTSKSFRIFEQEVSSKDIISDSPKLILDFLEDRKSNAYHVQGVYENNENIIIEFSPYFLKKSKKYTPVIAMMSKFAEDSTWESILESPDAMKKLKQLKQISEKNESNKMRYLGNHVYYFNHVVENV